jgi:putative endonuclease
MNRNLKRIGNWGEEAAVGLLKKKGYEILERNFRGERGEIDIIAREKETLVFVEVKTRLQKAFGNPEDAVGHRKQAQIGKIAMVYLAEMGFEEKDCRFDVVAISKAGAKTEIRHIEDAFWLDPDESEKW